MEMILAILLYLQIIVSPGTYYNTQIEQFKVQNQPAIDAVLQDDEQMRIVNDIYLPQVDQVIVIEWISGS